MSSMSPLAATAWSGCATVGSSTTSTSPSASPLRRPSSAPPACAPNPCRDIHNPRFSRSGSGVGRHRQEQAGAADQSLFDELKHIQMIFVTWPELAAALEPEHGGGPSTGR